VIYSLRRHFLFEQKGSLQHYLASPLLTNDEMEPSSSHARNVSNS
jgi:hypothetical protein